MSSHRINSMLGCGVSAFCVFADLAESDKGIRKMPVEVSSKTFFMLWLLREEWALLCCSKLLRDVLTKSRVKRPVAGKCCNSIQNSKSLSAQGVSSVFFMSYCFSIGKALSSRLYSLPVICIVVPWRGVNLPWVWVSCTKVKVLRSSVLLTNW